MYIYMNTHIYIYMLHKLLYEYNMAGAFHPLFSSNPSLSHRLGEPCSSHLLIQPNQHQITCVHAPQLSLAATLNVPPKITIIRE